MTPLRRQLLRLRLRGRRRTRMRELHRAAVASGAHRRDRTRLDTRIATAAVHAGIHNGRRRGRVCRVPSRLVKVEVFHTHVALVAKRASERALIAKVVSFAHVKVQIGFAVVFRPASFFSTNETHRCDESRVPFTHHYYYLLNCNLSCTSPRRDAIKISSKFVPFARISLTPCSIVTNTDHGGRIT